MIDFAGCLGSPMMIRQAILPAAEAALSPMRRMMLLVLAILTLATLGVDALARRTGVRADVIRPKVHAWWPMAGLCFLAATSGAGVSCVLMGLLCYLALKEYFTLIPTTAADRGALLLAYMTIPVQFYWIWSGWFVMAMVFIPVYTSLILPARQILEEETEEFASRTGRILWGVLLFVYFLSHLALLVMLGRVPGTEIGGRELLIYLVFLTEVNDVGAYLTGNALGKHRIAPRVSPNKTWEGVLGGLVTAVISAVLLRFLTPFSIGRAALAGLCISMAGCVGDLCVSAVKRDVGVKDASKFIPGHGGILDRIDSLTYTAPLFFHCVRYLYF